MNDVHGEPPNFIDARLLDGAAVLHLLPTVNVSTFDEYADEIFLPHISKQLESCTRVDIVWDIYIPNSIKESTREKEGKESEEKWKVKISCLENGQTFYMMLPINKSCLGLFPIKLVANVHFPENKELFIKLGSTAIIRGSNWSMGPCNHEEADTRLIVHLQDAILNGCYNSLVCTVDTDVASSYYRQILSLTIIMPKCYYLDCFWCRKKLFLLLH